MSIFSRNSKPKLKRSHFNLSHEKILSCNFGQIVPIYVEEVVPGDKFSCRTELMIKLAPLQSPVFSRIDAALHYFYVPNRILWQGWERYVSGTQTGTTTSASDYMHDNYVRGADTFPSLTMKTAISVSASQDPEGEHSHSGNWNPMAAGELFDYMTGNSAPSNASFTNLKINRLPFHAYQMIYDEYFRDENVGRHPIINAHDGSYGLDGTNGLNYYYKDGNLSDDLAIIRLCTLKYACWRKDYFTSALPWTQRGSVAKLLIDGSITGDISGTKMTTSAMSELDDVTAQFPVRSSSYWLSDTPNIDVQLSPGAGGMRVKKASDHSQSAPNGSPNNPLIPWGGYLNENGLGDVVIDPNGQLRTTAETNQMFHASAQGGGNLDVENGTISHAGNVTFDNPVIKNAVGATVGGITIPDVRRAFQLQRWLERTARGGYRYIEQILAHFGVRSSDKRLDRPEYLGGGKVPVVIGDVYQTSAKGSGMSTQLANRAGHGNAYGHCPGFSNKFIEEHGWIMGVMVVRPRAVYTFGIPRSFIKGAQGDKFDYFWPEFAHIGEQPLYNAELFWNPSNSSVSNFNPLDSWGYTPRYHEYRFHKSSIHGDFRTSLTYWHQARVYGDTSSLSFIPPALNSMFLRCSDATNYQCFYDTDSSNSHIWAFMTNHVHAQRPIPKFSDPGFADH